MKHAHAEYQACRHSHPKFSNSARMPSTHLPPDSRRVTVWLKVILRKASTRKRCSTSPQGSVVTNETQFDDGVSVLLVGHTDNSQCCFLVFNPMYRLISQCGCHTCLQCRTHDNRGSRVPSCISLCSPDRRRTVVASTTARFIQTGAAPDSQRPTC